MALNVPLQTKTSEFSVLASLQSNGKLNLSKNALSISSQNSKRRAHFPILCSIDKINGAAAASVVQKDSVSAPVPAEVLLGKSSFPKGFAFGAASSAYQVEGSWNEGGKGPSIWDTFTHQQPDKIINKSNGDVATDSYHRYKEDIKIMKQMGIDSYRFSISWSRILPDGTLKGGVNQEGVNYYNNLIDELLKNGIKPYVTIFHWDVPQALENKYGGFLDRQIVDDFKDYANVLFQQFGDRVKHWITLNEPWTFSSFGYGLGHHAPGRCSKMLGCSVGDSLTEPYIVTHNLILAHAAAARLYKDRYQTQQRGEVGITLVSKWFKPYSESYDDKQAAERSMDFMLGWYMDPLVNGDYPFIMRALVRDRLPYFTKEESEMIKGSFDFIGLNYYTSSYARSVAMSSNYTPIVNITDSYANQLDEKDGVPIGKLEGSWIYVYPIGMKDVLVYVKKKYDDPKIYITENGTAQLSDQISSLDQGLADKQRIDYLTLHLAQVRAAIQEGVQVKGYFAWSLTDNFEWEQGYNQRFGLTYIDFANDLKRHPKDSTKWYKKFLKS